MKNRIPELPTDRHFLFLSDLCLYGPFGSRTLFCRSRRNSGNIGLLESKSVSYFLHFTIKRFHCTLSKRKTRKNVEKHKKKIKTKIVSKTGDDINFYSSAVQFDLKNGLSSFLHSYFKDLLGQKDDWTYFFTSIIHR